MNDGSSVPIVGDRERISMSAAAGDSEDRCAMKGS